MREDQAYDAFIEAIRNDEKLKPIIESIRNHRKSLDELTAGIKEMFPYIVQSVLKENGVVLCAQNMLKDLNTRFSKFRSHPDTKACLKQEDVDYIIKLYKENFYIQANVIIKENQSMREIFNFDHRL